jgi:hypothetical protein
MSKIIGATVGTTISPDKIKEKLKPVKTVNGKAPDENGNVDTIPPVTEADNGKILKVVDGEWQAAELVKFYGEHQEVT